MSTERFKRFEKVTAGNEGNYANTPGDTGGETYRGISRIWWPKWSGWAIIDNYKIKVGRPLKNNEKIIDNNLEIAISDFYFANFYNPVRAESIKNESVALTIYDHGLGVDTSDATILAQKILNTNFGAKIPVDGKFGLITLNTLNAANPLQFYTLYNAAREAHYRSRAASVAGQAQFLNSWLGRLKKLSFVQTAAIGGSFLAFFF